MGTTYFNYSMLPDAIEIGKIYMQDVIEMYSEPNFSEWVKYMRREYGNDIEQYLSTIWKEINKQCMQGCENPPSMEVSLNNKAETKEKLLNCITKYKHVFAFILAAIFLFLLVLFHSGIYESKVVDRTVVVTNKLNGKSFVIYPDNGNDGMHPVRRTVRTNP